ncbi:transglycosylase SLT domain-containing protein [Quatrionicoccus australiensis]|uniref:transglycosylase SLT domain-containing protein n=1 Tax=Quatrionicoccus australiensis TaxID=138118 RepID=UPI001CFA3ED0|nr:transglycosylase SLT domain-containing protein [Quatrionicoccus australiensis]MCB4359603.1 transglycosylase SLT domain-containing protein [Quatrionicoccus australiensis]
MRRLFLALMFCFTSLVHAADEAPPASLYARVTGYLVAVWQLPTKYATDVATAAFAAAEKHDVDPALVLAVAAKESAFRHDVGNPGGGSNPRKPFGVMQVAGKWHADKFPDGQVRITTLAENFDVGAAVLASYLDATDGDVHRALKKYNGTTKNTYSTAVLRYAKTIGAVLAGRSGRTQKTDA